MIALTLVMAASLVATTPPTLAAMRWQKRVLLVSAPDATDPLLKEQRLVLSRWRAGAEDRDLAVVEIVGGTVAGTDEAARVLRQRYKLPTTDFAVLLIGKDGGTKLRRTQPISSVILGETIDAMPMRRSGGR
jgi:hypothetical protein